MEVGSTGEDVPFLGELVRPFRGRPESCETVIERPSKTATKIKKQPGRLWRTLLRPGQSNYLTCNTRHPCKDDVGGVQCTSSLPTPSDLFEFQTQVPVFITVKLLHFNLHWFADLPAEPHPAQCPHRLPAHTPVLQGPFFSFQHSCSTRFSSWLSQEQPLIGCHSCSDIQTGKVSFPKQLSLTSTAATKGYKLLFLTHEFSRRDWIQHAS